MKALISQGEVSIRWKYGVCQKEIVKAGGTEVVDQQCTTCIISRTDNQEEVTSGRVVRYVTDVDNKPIARKESFKKAVAGFSKADKKAAWSVYAANVKMS